MNPTERALRIENEQLRAELRHIRETMAPSSYRWSRLRLTPTLALVLDLLWESERAVSLNKIMLHVNAMRSQQQRKLVTDPVRIVVMIARLRARLNECVHSMHVVSLVRDQGYIILPAQRNALEKWIT